MGAGTELERVLWGGLLGGLACLAFFCPCTPIFACHGPLVLLLLGVMSNWLSFRLFQARRAGPPS